MTMKRTSWPESWAPGRSPGSCWGASTSWWTGEFHQQEKDLTLRFKGSRNQRIIDVNASRQADAVVLWDPENPEEN